MPLPKGSLRLAVSRRRPLLFADLGYFSLKDFADMNSNGVYWLSRVKSQCIVYDQQDNKSDLVEFLNRHNGDIIDQQILIGAEAMVMMRVRWQIELLFKLWKNEGHIDSWGTQKPWRILCELYAKLIAMVIQHWILLIGCWKHINRSFTKASGSNL